MNAAFARRLIASARAQAEAIGRPVSIAVVDQAGCLVAFERMDRALPVSVSLAQDKAYTAALMQMSTLALGQMAMPGASLYGIHTTHEGRIVIFGGGEPFPNGAIGVSGGTVAQDVQIARSALQTLTATRENAW